MAQCSTNQFVEHCVRLDNRREGDTASSWKGETRKSLGGVVSKKVVSSATIFSIVCQYCEPLSPDSPPPSCMPRAPFFPYYPCPFPISFPPHTHTVYTNIHTIYIGYSIICTQLCGAAPFLLRFLLALDPSAKAVD
jgi:hypothetical protein